MHLNIGSLAQNGISTKVAGSCSPFATNIFPIAYTDSTNIFNPMHIAFNLMTNRHHGGGGGTRPFHPFRQ
jgi:hypothetical protein